jgi:hypothetical protein
MTTPVVIELRRNGNTIGGVAPVPVAGQQPKEPE